MSPVITIDDRFTDVLETLGGVERGVHTAVRQYAVGQIVEKIAVLRAEDRQWQEKYGCGYETFVERMAADEEFHRHVEQNICLTWESDLIHWEFCYRGVEDWLRRLEELSGE